METIDGKINKKKFNRRIVVVVDVVAFATES